MKTPIFEFKINKEKQEQVAKYFFPNQKKFTRKELQIIIDEIERKACEYLNNMFTELQVLDRDLSYEIFLKELDIFGGNK